MPRPVLVIGNRNYSSWSLRAWLFLRVNGVDPEVVRLSLDTPEFTREIVRWSPAGRVPVLHDGDLVVWDSLAICEYASERWLDGRGWPADLAQRAHARSLAAEMHSGFAALRGALPMNIRASYPDFPLTDAVRRDVARIEQAWQAARGMSGAGAFLFGGFGIVDAMFAPVVLRFRSYGVRLGPDAQAYCATVAALPALQEWVAAARAETERVAADEVTPPGVTPG